MSRRNSLVIPFALPCMRQGAAAQSAPAVPSTRVVPTSPAVRTPRPWSQSIQIARQEQNDHEFSLLLSPPEDIDQHVTLSKKQHKTFHRFPKLPPELRQEIYKHALPPLGANSPHQLPLKLDDGTFDVTGERPFTFALISRKDRNDTGLAGACKESRYVYLKVFASSLPGPKNGVIRFNGPNTTIHLTEFWQRAMASALVKAPLRAAANLQSIFENVVHVSVTHQALIDELKLNPDLVRKKEFGFRNLKTFSLVLTHHWVSVAFREMTIAKTVEALKKKRDNVKKRIEEVGGENTELFVREKGGKTWPVDLWVNTIEAGKYWRLIY